MNRSLIFTAVLFAATLHAGEITRFDLDFREGYSARISGGQASFIRGNAAISDGAMLVKAGFASGAAGTPIPFNPLVYTAKDNMPHFTDGTITVEFSFRKPPEKNNYYSPLWVIRRVEHTKVTGYSRMQLRFVSGKVSLEYDEFEQDSPRGKTLRISIPLPEFQCGKNYQAVLSLNGTERTAKITGAAAKTVRAQWNFPEFLPRATAIVVGGLYENAGRRIDPAVEILIRRLTIREFAKEKSSRL